MSALIIVDVQNDFVDGLFALKNSPAKQDGLDVIPVINDLLTTIKFDCVVYTQDWHPSNHISFFENVHSRKFFMNGDQLPQLFDTVTFEGPPLVEQKLWPIHCVQHTWGAELHPKLKVVPDALFIKKGLDPEIDSYSAFWDNQKRKETLLFTELSNRQIREVFVCGLAYDYCVGSTALDAIKHNLKTYVVTDASKGTDFNEIENMRLKMIKNGVIVIDSSMVHKLIAGNRNFNPVNVSCPSEL